MQNRIIRHIQVNQWQYAFILGAFILGIILGNYKIHSLPSEVEQHLIQMIEQLLHENGLGGWSRIGIFISSFLMQVKVLLGMWFLGLTIVGIPIILLMVCYKGFALGFTMGFLINAKQGSGLLISLVSVLPQNIIYIPCMIMWAVLAVNFSRFIVKRSKNGPRLSTAFVRYSVLFLVFAGILMIGSFVEAVLTPWLIGWIR